MKVIVSKFLNVRVGSPGLNAKCYQYLAPGSELEVDDKLYKGDPYEGNDQWYKDGAGNYYWSGGVETPAVADPAMPDQQTDLSKLIQLEIPMPGGKGEGVTIAILDSGIDKSHGFKIIEEENFTNEEAVICDHGTCVMGLVVGENKNIIGMAKNAGILSYKVANGDCTIDNSAVVQALKRIDESNSPSVNLINLSLDIAAHWKDDVQAIIDRLNAKGIVTVVAATKRKYANTVYSLNNVIKVGAFDRDIFSLYSDGRFSDLDVFFLNEPFQSSSLNSKYTPFKDSSAYTAIITGLLGKFFTNNNIAAHDRLSKAKEFLNSVSIQPKNIIPYKIYKS